MRAGTREHIYPGGAGEQATIRAEVPPPPHGASTTTEPIRAAFDKGKEADKSEGV